jgi:hypothetical protein
MATITKGKTFVNGELVTPASIHALVDSATVANIVNADISASAAIADTKLATISTAGKVLPVAVQGTAVITTDSRLSDARTPTSHVHDDRYYQKTETNILLDGKQPLGSYAPTTHTHDDRYYTETEMTTLLAGKQASGSYAPATGIAPSAITGTAVITTDSRLSNARPPTAHTHDAADITAGTLANTRTTATAENTANTIVARDASGNIKGQDLISERFSPDGNCGILQFRKGMGTVSSPANTAGANPNLGIISFNAYSFETWEQAAAVVVNQVTIDASQRPIGNFQIQTRSFNGNFVSRLNINGDGNAVFSGTCSATVLFQTSDLEEKENINYNFNHGLEKVKSLKPVHFDFKTGPKGNLGFIAQDLVKEIPDAVISYNKVISENGIEQEVERLGLKEGHLVAVLVKAVQELAARVAALEAK